MVPEIIRWQTPLTHMRRTAMANTELGGKQIKKGDKALFETVRGLIYRMTVTDMHK